MSEKRKNFILYLIIFLTALPYMLLISRPELSSTQFPLKSLALYVSSILGFFGIVMLVWQLVLGTRSVAGLFSQNFASKIQVHKNLGIYGTLLIFLHPLLITIGYGYGLFYSIMPDISSSYEKAVTYGRFAFYFLIIIWVTSALLKSRIKFRPWKYIHYLSYPILVLSLLHIPSIGPSFNTPGIQFYWYVTVFVVIVCSVLRARHLFTFGKLSYTLVSKQQMSPGVYSLLFKPLHQNKFINIKPGQFVYIQYSFMGEEHPFSVLDFNNDTGDLVIVYKEFGSFTKKMTNNVNIGDIVLLDGPYGKFLNKMTHNNIFIAGGIGFTPFYKTAISGDGSNNIFIRAAKSNADLCYDEKLKNLLGNKYIRLLSKDNETIDKNSIRGYFKGSFIKNNISSYKEFSYFICGPDSMIDSVQQELQKIGVPNKNITTEKFGF
jgi:predicted ferric reductase